jgi:hypothetical protein
MAVSPRSNPVLMADERVGWIATGWTFRDEQQAWLDRIRE